MSYAFFTVQLPAPSSATGSISGGPLYKQFLQKNMLHFTFHLLNVFNMIIIKFPDREGLESARSPVLASTLLNSDNAV